MSLYSVKAYMLLKTTIFWLSASSFDRTYQRSPPTMILILMMERKKKKEPRIRLMSIGVPSLKHPIRMSVSSGILLRTLYLHCNDIKVLKRNN